MGSKMPNSSAADLLAEAHEDRIQRLETTSSTLMAQGVEHRADLKHVSEKLDQYQALIVSKLDSINSNFDSRLDRTASALESVTKTQVVDHEELKALVSKDATHSLAKRRTWNTVKKIAIAILLGISGVLAHKTGTALWLWFLR